MAGITGGTGTAGTTLPIFSVYSAAATGFSLREVGLFQGQAAGSVYRMRLVRLTTTGTPGTGVTAAKCDPAASTAQATPFNSHTVAPTLGDDIAYRFCIAATAGSGTLT